MFIDQHDIRLSRSVGSEMYSYDLFGVCSCLSFVSVF